MVAFCQLCIIKEINDDDDVYVGYLLYVKLKLIEFYR